MGVAQHAVNRNRIRKQPVKIRFSEVGIGVAHFRKIVRIDSEYITDFLIPFQVKNVEKLCPGRIGKIGFIGGFAGQLVDHPTVDGSVAKLTCV